MVAFRKLYIAKQAKLMLNPLPVCIAVTSLECPGYASIVTLFNKYLLQIEAMQNVLVILIKQCCLIKNKRANELLHTEQ